MSGVKGMRSDKLATMPPADQRPDSDWSAIMDKRRAPFRALHTNLNALTSDLGGDPSYVERSLAHRAVCIEAWLAAREAEMAEGHAVEIGAYLQATNVLVGVYRTLGTKRRSKPVPDLNEYLRTKSQETDQ